LEDIIQKNEKEVACDSFIKNLLPPGTTGGIQRFLNRDNQNILAETLCLIWFLDACIAFAQFDNPLFRKLIELVQGRSFPSSTTMVDMILPVLYGFATEHMKEVLRSSRSFFNSFDG
jgi:hypothetical protein